EWRRILARRPRGQVAEVLAAQGHTARGATTRGPAVLLAEPDAHLAAPCPVRFPDLAGEGRGPSALPVPSAPAHARHERPPGVPGPVPGAAVREARVAAHDDGIHASE